MLEKSTALKALSIVFVLLMLVSVTVLSGCSGKAADINTNALKKDTSETTDNANKQTFLLRVLRGEKDKAVEVTFDASDKVMLQKPDDNFCLNMVEIVIDGIPMGEVSLFFASYDENIDDAVAFDKNVKEGVYFGIEGAAITNPYAEPIMDRYYAETQTYLLKCDDNTVVKIGLGDNVDADDIEKRLHIKIPDASFGQTEDVKETKVVMAVNENDPNSAKVEFILNSDENWNIDNNNYIVPAITYNGSEVALFVIKDPKQYKVLSEDMHSSGTCEEGEYFSCPGEKALKITPGTGDKEIEYLINVNSDAVVSLSCPEWAGEILEKILTVKHV